MLRSSRSSEHGWTGVYTCESKCQSRVQAQFASCWQSCGAGTPAAPASRKCRWCAAGAITYHSIAHLLPNSQCDSGTGHEQHSGTLLQLVCTPGRAMLTGDDARRRRLHKRGSYMPPVRWYADTAVAVGLRSALPERLRFFIAADDSDAVKQFKVQDMTALRSPFESLSRV